ncbi:hypothetical protein BsWGS_27684 [Bradybaena similaris]
MAVHKEHTLRSFPSFPEIENFEDDDEYDNNFIISLEDNGDEEEDFSLLTSIDTSAPYTSNSTDQNADISNAASGLGADSSSKVLASSYSPDESSRDTVTYSQSQLTHLKSNIQPESQPEFYNSSKESHQCSYQHSLNGSLFSYPNYYQRSHLKIGINDKTGTSSCSNNINGTTAISKFTAGATYSSPLISQDVPAHFVHLENQNHKQQSIKSHVSQQILPTTYSELPKRQLETIHFDKEAGGIWSEAVFLNTTEVLDSSFPDFGTSAVHNHGTDLPVTNNNTIPKLSGPYLKTSNPQIVTDCLWNIKTGSTADSLPERVLKMQILNGNVSCSCVMCYKGKVNVGFQKSQNEDPHLTKDEKLSIFQKPTKRKKLAVSAIDGEKNKAQSKKANFEMTCPQISAMSVNNALKAPSVLSYASPTASALHTTSQMIDGLNTGKAAQSNLSSKSGVAAKKIILLDVSQKHIAANTLAAYNNIAAAGAKTSYLPCEPSKIITVTNVSSSHAVTPTVPHIMSIPRLSSYPAKVFLKPSEVPGQKPQAVSSALELNSGNTLSLPSKGQTSSALTQVSCKETPSTCVSPSASLTSPPSSKVIYVSSGQVFLYPHQARTPVSIISVNKQPQVKASNASHLAVIKLPSGNIPNTILPTDSVFKMCHQNVLNQNSNLNLDKRDNLNPCLNTVGESKTIRRLLSNSGKVDINEPRKVILKLKQHLNNPVTHSGPMHTPQVITAAGGTHVSTVSSGPVHMISLLKNSPQPMGVLSSSPLRFSDAHSVSTKSGYLTSKIQTSQGLGTPQTLVRLVNPVVLERPSTNSDNKIINVFGAGLQTSQSGTINCSIHNPQKSGNGTPKKLHHSLVPTSIDTLTYKSLPERDKPMQAGRLCSVKNASSPRPPQEGLPSTYIEDWVNKATTYVTDQLRDIDGIQEPHDFIPPSSDGDNEALSLLSSSQDTPKESVLLNLTNKKSGCINDTILEMSGGMEVAPDKQKAKRHLLMESPTCADFQKPNTLQVLQSDSFCTVSLNSSISTTSAVDNISMQKQLEQSPTLHTAGEKLSVSSALHKRSPEIVSTVHNIPHLESGRETSMISGNTPGWQLHNPSQAQPQSSSSILDSSKGIKLKIKLGMFRSEETKRKQSTDIAEPSVRNSENVPVSLSTGGVHLKECANINADIPGCDNDKQISNSENSNRTETAEEMFQRFQEQAVQEVVKAQMGMGYVSRSLRPTRTTMAFLDKYPYRFGPGRPKKVGLNEKNACTVSEKSGDSFKGTSKIHNLTETSGINKQHKKLHVRQKRQVDETADKEVKSKQPRLSIKDYPRLKQDYCITDSKTVYCTNILAGHKVYVKFNTFENICSERAFLVPFFNIGGSRTQFDVEDMEYINKAVMDFESEERSCARHLLFYSRAGNKAVFLRKETNLQASQINSENYRKCSFVLEGFKRNTKKQTESSPEHWKVDNTIDIEIDRAEIDNDIETEFDTHISLDEVADRLSIAADYTEGRKSPHALQYSNYNGVKATALSIHRNVKSPLLSQNRHSSSIKIGAYFSTMNESGTVNTECDISGVHTESDSISEMEGTTAIVPGASDETLVYINRFQGQLGDFQLGDVGRNVQQVLHPKTCSRVKEEVLIDETDGQCSFGHMLNPACIKKEKLGVDDEESVQQLNTSHPACNISSVNSSPHPDRYEEHMLDEIVFIKNEPADDYFNSLEETEQCSREDNQVKVPHVANVSCKSLTNLSIKPIHKQAAADQTVHFTSEDIIISNTVANAAHLTTSVIHASNLQDHATEPNTTASHTKISRLQLVDDIVPIQIHEGDSKTSSLDPALTSHDIDQSACGIDDSVSLKTASITGPSLPESPLPSSSMSYSTEILASSDIDESDFSTISRAGMVVTKVTSDDEDNASKQNIVQNKITSLVESLRHRLTQDTSNLPTWIANINTSTTETKLKKRKLMKVMKKRLKCKTAQVSGDLSSSAVDISTSSQTMSSLSSPVLSSMSHSVHHGPSVLPSPSTSSVYLATPSLPLDTLSSVVISSVSTISKPLILDPTGNSNNSLALPVPEKVAHESYVKHVSTSDICNASNSYDLHVADEKMSSETEDIIDIDDSFSIKCTAKTVSELVADTSQSDFVCAPKIKLSNDHFQARFLDNNATVSSETLNSNRQSPIDFDIEIGEEDLPETALGLQLIMPSENLDLEALKLNRQKHIREYGPDFSLLSSPKIATTFQQDDDDDIKQLYSVEKLTKSTSTLPRLEGCKTKHSNKKSSVINAQSCVNDYHTGKQISAESETRQEGSVASYLCKKFSSQGKHHYIKGPRLVHMPSNRRPSITEASKQRTPVQSTPNALTQAEPITTEELLKTPSLDEIFGASIKKELLVGLENKVDSVANSASEISVDSISRNKQMIMHLNTSKAKISKKKKNKKVKKHARFSSDATNPMAGEPQLNTAASAIKTYLPSLTSHGNLTPHPVNNQTEAGSEALLKMNVCKVVLTKLKLSSFDRLSENVFKTRETAVKERPYVKLTKIDSVSVSHANSSIDSVSVSHVNNSINSLSVPCVSNSKSTFKRVVKKKRRKITRPGFRRRGDIIDYYNYMLENLHKKQQQLEEETRKKEEEESAKKVQLQSIRMEEVKLLEKSTDANERDEIVASFEVMISQEANNTEMEEVKNVSSQEVEVGCLLPPCECIASYLEAPINAMSTNNKDEPACKPIPECDILSEKAEDSESVDCVCLTDTVEASKKVVHNGAANGSDSDWPCLQKFCDETIFGQGNIDYLQKVSNDICFSSLNEISHCELKFEKKDIVLCSNVNDKTVLGEFNSCETLSNTEDASACIEQFSDEQDIGIMDEDEILMDLKIKGSSEFSCDDQETRKLSFSQSPTDMHISSVDDRNNTNCKSRGISLDANTPSQENAQSMPASCELESTDQGTTNSCTAGEQPLNAQNVPVKHEKPQRTVDIAPSWERLLGHNSIDISSQSGDDTSALQPQTSQNRDVSFVASSNFKLKFKLPKGILSQACRLSRDMKNMSEQQSSNGTLLSKSEVLPHKSLDEGFTNNRNPQDNCKKLTGNDDFSEGHTDCVSLQPCENQKACLMSQMSSKLKFSSATLNAIQRAKAEFLQKRTSENRCIDVSEVESQFGKENTLVHHQQRSDIDHKLAPDSVSYISAKESNELCKSSLDSVCSDLSLNEGIIPAPNKQLPSMNANVGCKEVHVEAAVQAEDGFTNPQDNCKKLTGSEDSCEGHYGCVSLQPCVNQKACLISQSVSKLKFSSVTLDAIQRAKAEFLQKRASENRCIDVSEVEQTYSVDLPSIFGKENTIRCQESSDIDQKLAPDNVSYSSGQESNELYKSSLDSVCSDLSFNEGSIPAPNKQLPSMNANVECKEVHVEAAVQAEDVSASELVSSVGDLTTDSALPSMCLTQRNDGIFSNLDLFQGCDADAPKKVIEQSSSKEVLADNISKVNAIDIRKLKLKLNPLLLSKFKETTQKSPTSLQQSAPISSVMIEKLAQKSFHKLQQKLNPHNVTKQKLSGLNIGIPQQSVESTSVAKAMVQHYGFASVGLLDLQASSESDSSNVKLNDKLDANISHNKQSLLVNSSSDLVTESDSSNVKLNDKLDANISQSQPVNSSSGLVSEGDSFNVVKLNGHAFDRLDTVSQSHPVNSSSDSVSLPTCRQLSQVNTAKLCTILKNFHKAGSTVNSVLTNSESELLNSNTEKMVNIQDARIQHIKLQRALRKSSRLSCAAVEADARHRTRARRKKYQHEVMMNTDITRAKRIKQISPPEQLAEGHHGSVYNDEQLDTEDKGERSFVDCLPSVPLDAWE